MIPDRISKYDDIIDSGTLMKRIGYLSNHVNPISLDEGDELLLLNALVVQISDGHYVELEPDVPIVRDSFFTEFVKHYSYESGLVKGDELWPFNCIDWSQAAEELKQLYKKVIFDDIVYWVFKS